VAQRRTFTTFSANSPPRDSPPRESLFFESLSLLPLVDTIGSLVSKAVF
jgi:hypothetical protein